MIIFKGKVHMVITIAVMYLINPQLEHINLWFIVGGLIGSILPDCDDPYILAGRILPLRFFKVKHGSITHSLFFCGAFSALMGLVNISFGLGNALGYSLHLLGDKIVSIGRKPALPNLLWYPRKKV